MKADRLCSASGSRCWQGIGSSATRVLALCAPIAEEGGIAVPPIRASFALVTG